MDICVICNESLTGKDPRILPCDHIFCLECLYHLQGAYLLKCSVCDKNFEIPSRDVSNFPKLSNKTTGNDHEQNNNKISLYNSKPKNLIFVKKIKVFKQLTRSFSIVNEGIYSVPFGNYETLYFKSSFSTCDWPTPLNKEVSDIAVTNNTLYAIDRKTNKIVYAKKPFGDEIKFRFFNSVIISHIMAMEDEDNKDYLIGKLKDLQECFFFYDRTFKWMRQDCKEIGCILHNGNPIIKNLNNCYLILDKFTGKVLTSLSYPQKSEIFDLSPHGILITKKLIKTSEVTTTPSRSVLSEFFQDFKCVEDEVGIVKREPYVELYLFDYKLNVIRLINKFHQANLIGTTKNGYVCFLYQDGKIKIYEWK